jgi:CRISPR/Cas system-associated exonuclease Cas4 (RecB family)
VKVTGSSLPLLRKCSWWARPEVIAPPQPPPTEAMLLGTAVHAAIESTIIDGAQPKMTPEVADIWGVWNVWWAHKPFGDGKWFPEQAYAYTPGADTARILDAKARAYNVAQNEIAGTVDAVMLDLDSAIVVDWKTGDDFQRLTADAKDNWQLKLYALAVSRAHKVDTVKVAIVRISDEVRVTEYTLDALELDAVAEDVQKMVQAVRGSQPTPGHHCIRCKAVAVCPTTSVAETAITEVAATLPEEVTGPAVELVINADNATSLLTRLRQVQAACESMEAALKVYAVNNDGITLPSGKRWRKVPQDRESINLNGPEMATGLAALNAVGADGAVEHKVSITKAAIEKALKAQGLKGKALTTKLESVMGELRAAGCVRTTTVDAWREG